MATFFLSCVESCLLPFLIVSFLQALLLFLISSLVSNTMFFIGSWGDEEVGSSSARITKNSLKKKRMNEWSQRKNTCGVLGKFLFWRYLKEACMPRNKKHEVNNQLLVEPTLLEVTKEALGLHREEKWSSAAVWAIRITWFSRCCHAVFKFAAPCAGNRSWLYIYVPARFSLILPSRIKKLPFLNCIQSSRIRPFSSTCLY